jgi:hypothetical protein
VWLLLYDWHLLQWNVWAVASSAAGYVVVIARLSSVSYSSMMREHLCMCEGYYVGLPSVLLLWVCQLMRDSNLTPTPFWHIAAGRQRYLRP